MKILILALLQLGPSEKPCIMLFVLLTVISLWSGVHFNAGDIELLCALFTETVSAE